MVCHQDIPNLSGRDRYGGAGHLRNPFEIAWNISNLIVSPCVTVSAREF